MTITTRFLSCLLLLSLSHLQKHIFARIRIPVPRFASVLNSRELTPSYYPGGEVPLAELGGPTEAELLVTLQLFLRHYLF